MHWWSKVDWWLVLSTMLVWIWGLSVFVQALKINKESHKKKRLLEYTPFGVLPAIDFDLSIAGAIGFLGWMLLDFIISLLIGAFLKYSPWWLAKSFMFLYACGLFWFGSWLITRL
jgi:hypothetical protein